MATQDYKRFLNFLAAHDCTVDFREFRHGSPPPLRSPRLLPPLDGATEPAMPATRTSVSAEATRSAAEAMTRLRQG